METDIYTYSHSIKTRASKTSIWALWSNPSSWSRWDPALEEVKLDGPFEPGTSGTMSVKNQGTLTFTLTDVRPFESFSDESEIPGALIRFSHHIQTDGSTQIITHSVEIDGPRDVTQAIGEKISQDIPETMNRLTKLAEQESSK